MTAVRPLKTRKGDRMAVFTVEDSTGAVEAIAFPEAFQRAASLIETGTMVVLRGKVEHDDDSLRLLAAEVMPIDALQERLAREVSIRMTLPAAQGVFLATNPHSSFFYMLTGLHGLHLLGGLFWFAAVLVDVRRMAYTPGEDGLRLFATYWHFLGALWLYLLVLLFVL